MRRSVVYLTSMKLTRLMIWKLETIQRHIAETTTYFWNMVYIKTDFLNLQSDGFLKKYGFLYNICIYWMSLWNGYRVSLTVLALFSFFLAMCSWRKGFCKHASAPGRENSWSTPLRPLLLLHSFAFIINSRNIYTLKLKKYNNTVHTTQLVI